MGKMKNMLTNLKDAMPEQKQKPERTYQAPAARAKKSGVIGFWVLMFTIVFLLISLLGALKNQEAAPVVEEKPENVAVATEGVEFGKKFADAYFTWQPTTDGWLVRRDKLAPLMAAGLDEHGGLLVSGQTWESKTGDIRAVNVEEMEDNKSMITYEVEQVLSKEGEDNVTVSHLFTVPIGYQSGFAAYDLPSFTAIDQTSELEAVRLQGGPVEAGATANITNFLPTFFESYSSDKPDALAYLVAGDQVQGLEGALIFEEVRDVQVAAGNRPGEYKAEALVVMREPETGTGYAVNYHLGIAEKDGRYVVTNINEGGN